MVIRAHIGFALALAFASLTSAQELAARLDAAQRSYDAVEAAAILDEAVSNAAVNPARESQLLVARAGLLVAELLRIKWEQFPESNIADRRPLGDAIDKAAEAGLRALESLQPNSEAYRLKADLLATMIRSDYRAKKYRKEMEAAAAQAVELDPENARAYVTQAKPFVFADPNEGGDPAEAIALLSKALELNPDLETARCLRGLAYKKAGDVEQARADWELALQKNPECAPAKEELAKLGAVADSE